MSGLIAALLLSGLCSTAFAQSADDNRAQYPAWLANSYVTISAGAIFTPFSGRQLEQGLRVDAVTVPHAAARIVLFGHELTRHVAVQIAYMRPVQFASYRSVNGDGAAHHVWTGFGSATFVARAPLAGRLSIFGEAGLGIASRHGFEIDGAPAVRDASYAAALAGGGLEYRVSAGWDATAGVTYMPGHAGTNDPHTVMANGGFRYTMRPRADERVRAAQDSGYVFHKRLVQLEVTTSGGYAIDSFFANKVPIFWVGQVNVTRGFAAHVDRNVFHTSKIFALDVGTSASVWRTRGAQSFYTLSVYPLLRFVPIRTRRADFYVSYAVAGPTFISTHELDGRELGGRFTFQDFMGAGICVGEGKHITLGVKINHYSNGNLFPENAGVTVPVTATLGCGVLIMSGRSVA